MTEFLKVRKERVERPHGNEPITKAITCRKCSYVQPEIQDWQKGNIRCRKCGSHSWEDFTIPERQLVINLILMEEIEYLPEPKPHKNPQPLNYRFILLGKTEEKTTVAHLPKKKRRHNGRKAAQRAHHFRCQRRGSRRRKLVR